MHHQLRAVAIAIALAALPISAAQASPTDAHGSNEPKSAFDRPSINVGGAYMMNAAPMGHAVFALGMQPSAAAEVEGFVGFGNPFGPTVGTMVRFGFPMLYDTLRLGVGIGYSRAIVKSAIRDLGTPSSADYLTFELFYDMRLGGPVIMRFGSGISYLLNHDKFGAVCEGLPGSTCDSRAMQEIPFDHGPYSAASGKSPLEFSARFGLVIPIAI